MTEHTYQRDTSSSALINTDKEGLQQHKLRRQKAKEEIQWRRDLEARVAELEALVQSLVSR